MPDPYPFFHFLLGQVKLWRSSCTVSAPQGKDYFIMKPTHMLVLVLVWQSNGPMPKGARSLEVHEVWETPGKRRAKQGVWAISCIVYCIIEKQAYEGRCWMYEIKKRCVRACGVIIGKHLNHREKYWIFQAHAQLMSWCTVNTCPPASARL